MLEEEASRPSGGGGAASALHCRAHGAGLQMATVRQQATFTIDAHDENGERCARGGDAFFVAIRGGSRVRARVCDNDDGSYTVRLKPSVSGFYDTRTLIYTSTLDRRTRKKAHT